MQWKINDVLCFDSLMEYNPVTHKASLGAPYLQNQLSVDTSLIEPFNGKIGSLYQLIGDIESFTDGARPRLLTASCVRCVDGLDLFEYCRAIDRQRRYFQQREEFMQIGSVCRSPDSIPPEKENHLDPDGLELMPPSLKNISNVDDFEFYRVQEECYSDLDDSNNLESQ